MQIKFGFIVMFQLSSPTILLGLLCFYWYHAITKFIEPVNHDTAIGVMSGSVK